MPDDESRWLKTDRGVVAARQWMAARNHHDRRIFAAEFGTTVNFARRYLRTLRQSKEKDNASVL